MKKSKALKSSFRSYLLHEFDYDSLNLLKKTAYKVKKFFHYISDLYHRHKSCAKRSYEYAKFGWSNYDFDHGSVYRLMEFKLKRLRHALKNGHAIHEESDLKALDEYIKIIRRLHRERYEDKYLRLHDAKWGKLEHKTEPINDQGKIEYYEFISWRKNTKDAPEDVKKKERSENNACYEKAEQDRRADIDRLAVLLKDFSSHWWD